MRKYSRLFRQLGAGLVAVSFIGTAPAFGATVWSGTDTGNPWWGDAANWTSGLTHADTDAQINNGFDFSGEGVVFDQDNDPNSLANPFDVYRFYLSHTGGDNPTSDNKLTIKSGYLQIKNQLRAGRIAGSNTVIVQTGGKFAGESAGIYTAEYFTIGDAGTSTSTFEHHGGTFEWNLGGGDSTAGLRLGAGSGSSGKVVVGNSGPAGRFAAENFLVSYNSNSTGTVEFRYVNGGVRTIQVGEQLSLRNSATQSSRLALVLDEAPVVDVSFVPEDLALFTVGGRVSGVGENFRGFFSEDGLTAYDQGDIVSAMFGGETYNWTISYTGSVTFSDPLTTQISSISATGGQDIVLIGHSSTIPEPATAALALVGIGLLATRRR